VFALPKAFELRALAFKSNPTAQIRLLLALPASEG
jgi:hypothetical protein